MLKENAYSIKSICLDAVISTVLGGISCGCIAVAIIASYLYNGEGPVVIGLLGVGAFLFSVCGFFFSLTAWKSQDGGLLMKRIAFILNVTPLALALIFYFVGLFIS